MMPSTTNASTPEIALIIVTLSMLVLLCLGFSDHAVWRNRCCGDYLLSTGIIYRTKVITAGPKITTIKAGKMKNTRGGTILTLVLALISSARWRRLVRLSSENTRSD